MAGAEWIETKKSSIRPNHAFLKLQINLIVYLSHRFFILVFTSKVIWKAAASKPLFKFEQARRPNFNNIVGYLHFFPLNFEFDYAS